VGALAWSITHHEFGWWCKLWTTTQWGLWNGTCVGQIMAWSHNESEWNKDGLGHYLRVLNTMFNDGWRTMMNGQSWWSDMDLWIVTAAIQTKFCNHVRLFWVSYELFFGVCWHLAMDPFFGISISWRSRILHLKKLIQDHTTKWDTQGRYCWTFTRLSNFAMYANLSLLQTQKLSRVCRGARKIDYLLTPPGNQYDTRVLRDEFSGIIRNLSPYPTLHFIRSFFLFNLLLQSHLVSLN